MKSYTHLARGVQQIVDIHQGLEYTLRLFSYKLKQGIEIRRLYVSSLPKITAYGSELNQAWTNLLDNAIDAIAQEGVIEIVTAVDNNMSSYCLIIRPLAKGHGIEKCAALASS